MAAEVAIGTAAGGLLVSVLAGVTVRSLRDFSRSELEELARARQALSRFAAIVAQHAAVAESLAAVQALGLAAAAAGFAAAWHPQAREGWLGWGLLVLGWWGAAWLVVAVEIDGVAWLARRWGERWLLAVWPVAAGLHRLLALVGFRLAGWALGRTERVPHATEAEEQFEEEIRTIVDEGHREGLLEKEARGMIEGVMELRDAEVSEIMTPRTDMLSLHVGRSLEEAARFALEGGHSRIPVYDKTRDDIVGVLYAKDLLGEFARAAGQPRRPLAEIVRQPFFVPETKPVHDLLREFQQTRNHMAVVLDEYGGVSGLVTIEDVLEEIVGEIADEYDEAHVDDIKQIDERTAEVSARVHIDELNNRLGIELSEESDFDTIGGFVFTELGRIPRPGEVVVWNNVRITVMEVSRRRIERLKIEVLDQAPSEPA